MEWIKRFRWWRRSLMFRSKFRVLVIACLMSTAIQTQAAEPQKLFIKFEFPSGGNEIHQLQKTADSWQEITGRVEFYKKDDVWHLRSTLQGEAIWHRTGVDPFDLGSGFVVKSNKTGKGSPIVTVVQVVE